MKRTHPQTSGQSDRVTAWSVRGGDRPPIVRSRWNTQFRLSPALADVLFLIFTFFQSLPTGIWSGTGLYPPLPDLSHGEV